MNTEATFRAILGSQTSSKAVHAQALLEVLMASSAEDRVSLLTIALVERDSVPKTPIALSNKGLPREVWDALSRTHSTMVNGHLKMAFAKSRKGEEFAREILRLLEFCQTEEEKTFALGGCLWSEYVPFRQLPGEPVHMSEEEYAHVLQANKEKKEFIEYISQLPFDQLTERASMVLQVVDDIDEKRLRVALVALALGQMEMKGIKRVADMVQRPR